MAPSNPAPSAGHWQSVRMALRGGNFADVASRFKLGGRNPKSVRWSLPAPIEGAVGEKARVESSTRSFQIIRTRYIDKTHQEVHPAPIDTVPNSENVRIGEIRRIRPFIGPRDFQVVVGYAIE